MRLNLENRHAVITGGSRGIGFATAEALLREDIAAVTLISSDGEALKLASQSLSERWPNTRIRYLEIDLSDQSAILALDGQLDDVDILINCAGAIPHGTLDHISDETWLRSWDLKVHGAIRLTRLVYPHMSARGGGVILNVIGYAGERPMANYLAGTSGNAALIGFTRALGSASPADNIRVIGINPGHILTERLKKRLLKRAQDELGDESKWPKFTEQFPFGRAGNPEEVADVIAFLASDRAGYMSGTIVTVDGGMASRPAAT